MVEQNRKGIPAHLVVEAGAVLSIAGAAIAGFRPTSLYYWIFIPLLALLALISDMILRKLKPQLFARRWGTDTIERGYELPSMILMALCTIATITVSAYDFFHLNMGYLGTVASFAGMLIASLSASLYQQACLAYPPHGKTRYNEDPDDKAKKGAYSQVRHPEMGFYCLTVLGIALLFSSWLGLIGWLVNTVLIIAYVTQEDNWRYTHYEWYYDYTCVVRKRMIPLIW